MTYDLSYVSSKYISELYILIQEVESMNHIFSCMLSLKTNVFRYVSGYSLGSYAYIHVIISM